MKLCVIIAEYNPFHRGHKEQIEYIRTKYPEHAIAVIMSGNMVQRGELAILDKYTRARAALLCGADLVLELPYPYCCSSAGYFAFSGVSIADRIGADMLCFGSECGEVSLIERVARRTLSEGYIDRLEALTRENKNTSNSYISLYRRAYLELYGEEIPEGANNTLAIEYCRAITALGSDIVPITNKRTSPYSATASRYYYRNGKEELFSAVPKELEGLYKKEKACDGESVANIILWYFRNADAESLCELADTDTGLAARLIASAGDSTTLEELYSKAATKKYTDSRVRRAVFNCLFGVKKELLDREPSFSVLLAANSLGCKALKEIKKRSAIPIITKPADYRSYDEDVQRAFLFSNKADMLFATAVGEKSDDILRKGPVIIETE
ncbi:MAG: nucleotidyltransferase family protein [Ruminococcaceae bacterium]|nr:nucleotidyltransferase family protein [Oscillospiraceae bacterium]